MSPSSPWAKSVIPTVATSPSKRTHSCDRVYLRSAGIEAIALPVLFLSRPLVEGGLDLLCRHPFATDLDVQRLADSGVLRRNQRQSDILAQGRRECTTRYLADCLPVDADRVMRARRPAPLSHAEANGA